MFSFPLSLLNAPFLCRITAALKETTSRPSLIIFFCAHPRKRFFLFLFFVPYLWYSLDFCSSTFLFFFHSVTVVGICVNVFLRYSLSFFIFIIVIFFSCWLREPLPNKKMKANFFYGTIERRIILGSISPRIVFFWKPFHFFFDSTVVDVFFALFYVWFSFFFFFFISDSSKRFPIFLR